ncbi:IS110 family transposase, partial [Xanthovirga aplysinae]|uniref:IS110 family transposase n=1 Tax=Xanthovirga aplysinae TaxID=2529853 RepID=UPI0012BBAD18
MQTKQTTTTPKLFIGIDIHKRSWKIQTATDLFLGKGFNMEPDTKSLKSYVEKNYPGYEVHSAYEAGCCGYSAHRAFESYGWKSIVFNPADISRTGKSQYQKTDKIDARLICRELKDGRLEGITVPDQKREQLRSLFRRRNELVKDFRQVKSRLKSHLLFFGIKVPNEHD